MSEEKPRRFIGLAEVKYRVNLSKTSIYREINKGIFPKRYPNGWLESEIDKYIDDIVLAHNPVGTNDDQSQREKIDSALG